VVNVMTVNLANASHAQLPREVRLLVAARVVNRLGAFTLAFLPLLLVATYGASLRTAGLVCAGFGLATVASRLLGGRLSERLGHRTTIVLGLCGCVLAQLVLAVAPGLALAGAAAILLGLCFEIYEPPSQALLAYLTPPGQRARAFSAFGAALAAAGVVAGLLAALLAGLGLRWLFVADAVTCLACAGMIRRGLPDPRVTAVPAAARPSPWLDRRLRLMLATGTCFATVYMTMMCGLPLALHHDGSAAGWAGVLVAVSAATVIVASRLTLTARSDPFRRMRSGYTLLATGLLLAGAAALAPPDGWWYVGPVVVWSLGDAILLGEPLAVVAELTGDADRGRYLAAYGVSWGVATTVAPALAAGLLALGGSPALWGACGLTSLVLAGSQRRVGIAVTQK
jgi:MFS family permease